MMSNHLNPGQETKLSQQVIVAVSMALQAKLMKNNFNYAEAENDFKAVADANIVTLIKSMFPTRRDEITEDVIAAVKKTVDNDTVEQRVGIMLDTLSCLFVTYKEQIYERTAQNLQALFKDNSVRLLEIGQAVFDKIWDYSQTDFAFNRGKLSQLNQTLYGKLKGQIPDTVDVAFIAKYFETIRTHFRDKTEFFKYLSDSIERSYLQLPQIIERRLNEIAFAAKLTSEEKEQIRIAFFEVKLEKQEELTRIGKFSARLLSELIYDAA